MYDHVVAEPHIHSPAEDERRALRAAGLTVPVPYPVLTVPTEQGALKKFGVTAGQYVAVHFFSGSVKRALHPDRRRALVLALRAALPADVQILLTGARGDRQEAETAAGTEARVIAGEASLGEMADLITHARATVSVDTGVAHIAAQLHKRVLVITTCMGLWWWNEEQYGPNASYKAFTAPLHPIPEHPMDDYPACLNTFDINAMTSLVAKL